MMKSNIINIIVGVSILILLSVAFFMLLQGFGESSSNPEYKEWKKQTEVVKGKVVETGKRDKMQTLIVKTNQDKTTINVPNGHYKKDEAVKCRVYKKDGKLIKDLNKQKDINSASDYYDYFNDQMPSWKNEK